MYFSGINNIRDLKERYSELIMEYHPVLHNDRKHDYMRICMDIEKEFKDKAKQLRDKSMYNPDDGFKNRGLRIMESVKASEKRLKFVESVSTELNKLPIYRKYFTFDDVIVCPDDDILVSGGSVNGDGFIISCNDDLANDVFHSCFYDLCLDIDDVEKLYELCDCNAEKFKRVILFIREGNLEPFDFRINLYSDDTIPFFDDEIVEDGLPNYDSSMVIIREFSTSETIRAWSRFCDRQSELFDEKHYSKLKDTPKVAVKK